MKIRSLIFAFLSPAFLALGQSAEDLELLQEAAKIKAAVDQIKGLSGVVLEAKAAAERMPDGPDKDAVKKGLEKSAKAIVVMGEALDAQRESVIKRANASLKEAQKTVPSIPEVKPVTSSRPSREFPKDVDAEIRQYAADKWGSNYDMRDYEVKQQEKALALFNDYRVNGIAGLPSDVSSKIMRDAWDKWGINFDMCVYEADLQRKAWWKLNPYKKD